MSGTCEKRGGVKNGKIMSRRPPWHKGQEVCTRGEGPQIPEGMQMSVEDGRHRVTKQAVR